VASPQDPLVYVRYKDHVLFKNVKQPAAGAIERETVGWLSKQTDEIMLVEHDRTVPNAQIPSGRGNGLIILKSCITELRKLPPKETLEWHLNCQPAITKSEYALPQTKRKTQTSTGTGATK